MSDSLNQSNSVDEKWPVWLFSYDFEGASYSFSIPARTAQEAEKRVRSLALYGRLDGELKARIPVSDAAAGPASWFVRLWCWWKNP